MSSRWQRGRSPNCESGSRGHADDPFPDWWGALVTGAAKGIGAGIAKAMAAAGAGARSQAAQADPSRSPDGRAFVASLRSGTLDRR